MPFLKKSIYMANTPNNFNYQYFHQTVELESLKTKYIGSFILSSVSIIQIPKAEDSIIMNQNNKDGHYIIVLTYNTLVCGFLTIIELSYSLVTNYLLNYVIIE